MQVGLGLLYGSRIRDPAQETVFDLESLPDSLAVIGGGRVSASQHRVPASQSSGEIPKSEWSSEGQMELEETRKCG